MQLIKRGEFISINGKEVTITSVKDAGGGVVEFGITPAIAGCDKITMDDRDGLDVVYCGGPKDEA